MKIKIIPLFETFMVSFLRRELCLVLLFIFSFSVVGCSTQVNKIYAYKDPIVKYDWGEVGGRLLGDFKTTGSLTTQGSPYEVLFSFDIRSGTKVNGSATVTSVELYNADDNTLVYKSKEVLEETFEQYVLDENLYWAVFSIEDQAVKKKYANSYAPKKFKLKYFRYKLVVKFKIKTENITTEDVATLYFEKDFKEFRTNPTWQRFINTT